MTNWPILANRYFEAECAECRGEGRVFHHYHSICSGWENEVTHPCRECDMTGAVMIDIHAEDSHYKATCLCAECSAEDEPALPSVAPEVPAEWQMEAS